MIFLFNAVKHMGCDCCKVEIIYYIICIESMQDSGIILPADHLISYILLGWRSISNGTWGISDCTQEIIPGWGTR